MHLHFFEVAKAKLWLIWVIELEKNTRSLSARPLAQPPAQPLALASAQPVPLAHNVKVLATGRRVSKLFVNLVLRVTM